MALIKCPECGKEVSDKAPRCIQCGNPLFITPKTPIQEAAKTPIQEPPKAPSEIKPIQPQKTNKTKPFSIPLGILGFVIGIPALILIIFVATLGMNYLKYQAGLKKQIEGYQQNKQESQKLPEEPKQTVNKPLEKGQATSDTSWEVFWQKYYKAVMERDSKTLKIMMTEKLDTNGGDDLTSEKYLKSMDKNSWVNLAFTVVKGTRNFPPVKSPALMEVGKGEYREIPDSVEVDSSPCLDRYAGGKSPKYGDPIFSRDSNGNWKMSGFVGD